MVGERKIDAAARQMTAKIKKFEHIYYNVLRAHLSPYQMPKLMMMIIYEASQTNWDTHTYTEE